MSESLPNLDKNREAIVIDVDDTVIDLGPRRVALFETHFPKSDKSTLGKVRKDPTLSSIRDREAGLFQNYLSDFADPEKVADLPVDAVDGAIEAINGLEESGLEVILLTGRPEKLREQTIIDLQEVGLDWTGKKLIMSEETIDPADGAGFRSYKRDVLIRLGERHDIVAVVGNSASDITAAFDANVPAILLCVPPLVEPVQEFKICPT